MEVHQALREAMGQAGWNAVRLATETNTREGSAYKWLRGKATPGGNTLLILMHKLPGFARRLGFEAVRRAA